MPSVVEIARGDRVPAHAETLRGRRLDAVHEDVGRGLPEAEGDGPGEAGGLDVRVLTHAREPGQEEVPGHGGAAVEQGGIHVDEADAGDAKAGLEGPGALQLAQEEPGADEEHEAERDLRRHEGPAGALGHARDAATAPLQHLNQVHPGRGHGRGEAEGEAGQKGGDHGEERPPSSRG